MLASGFWRFVLTYWTTGLALSVGSTVAGLVFVTLRRYGRRRRLLTLSTGEDLPWEDLLELLRARERELAGSDIPPDKDLPPEELLALLLSRLPAQGRRRPYEIPPEERQYLESGGIEKRVSRRRWGNPTEVQLTSPLLSQGLHGIVINRSAGGLGIFVDQKVQPGMLVEVRSVEAPYYVPATEVEVKYCRKVRKHFFLGCQFQKEIPWNVRVWFG
jgi:hypothetical protein